MRAFHLVAGAVVAAGLFASTAVAAGFFHSVKDKVAKKECGACHMPYPPSLLPARSWQKILGSLDNHFGENASLPEPMRLAIVKYMTANAGDSPNGSTWFMRGVRPDDTPGRITEMPFWRAIHGGFSPTAFKRPNVKKAGNCIGCHG